MSDRLVLRQFCRVYAQRVPDDTTVLRHLIQSATLHLLLAHGVALARSGTLWVKVTRCRKLRMDGTVVDGNEYPLSC